MELWYYQKNKIMELWKFHCSPVTKARKRNNEAPVSQTKMGISLKEKEERE